MNLALGHRYVECHALPKHDLVKSSGLGNLNAVITLLSSLEARLNFVEVMYLERFEMFYGE